MKKFKEQKWAGVFLCIAAFFSVLIAIHLKIEHAEILKQTNITDVVTGYYIISTIIFSIMAFLAGLFIYLDARRKINSRHKINEINGADLMLTISRKEDKETQKIYNRIFSGNRLYTT